MSAVPPLAAAPRPVPAGAGALPARPRRPTAQPPPTLAGRTLMECGVSPKGRVSGKVAARGRADAPRLTRTYSLSVSILFLARLEDSADRTLIRVLALSVIAGQTTNGGWGYTCPVLSP